MIGHWAHALTDVGDTVGTMLFFPWTQNIHLGAWAYAGQTGRLTDAAAYFSGLGCMWDLVFVVYGLINWRAAHDELLQRDDRRRRRLLDEGRHGIVPSRCSLTLYRVAFFYGDVSLVAWTVWVHVASTTTRTTFIVGRPHWVGCQSPDW